MKVNDVVRYFKLLLALIVVATLLGVLIPAVRTSGIAQSNSEREFEDKIPKHLPIKIKIQPEKEKAAKDLNNGRWHHDLAFEVKNIGDKPIYYLSLYLDMPEINLTALSLEPTYIMGSARFLVSGRGWPSLKMFLLGPTKP